MDCKKTKKAFRRRIRNSVHYVNLKLAKEKLVTELLFLKDANIRDKNALSHNRYSKDFVHKTKQFKKESRKLYFLTAIKFIYSLALT